MECECEATIMDENWSSDVSSGKILHKVHIESGLELTMG